MADSIDATLPNRFKDLVLRHHPIAMLDEIEQQIKNLRLDSPQVAVHPQLMKVRIELAIAENVDHPAPRSASGLPRHTSKKASKLP